MKVVREVYGVKVKINMVKGSRGTLVYTQKTKERICELVDDMVGRFEEMPEGFNITKIAEQLHMHIVYLSKLYKETTGISITQKYSKYKEYAHKKEYRTFDYLTSNRQKGREAENTRKAAKYLSNIHIEFDITKGNTGARRYRTTTRIAVAQMMVKYDISTNAASKVCKVSKDTLYKWVKSTKAGRANLENASGFRVTLPKVT